MQHDHLKFFAHSASSIAQQSAPGNNSGFSLGGSEVIPVLRKADSEHATLGGTNRSNDDGYYRARTAVEKHVEIVEYLKHLPHESRATFVDIKRELNIDLGADIQVLGMLKSNPKVDQQLSSEGITSFSFRAKFTIRNKQELIDIILRVRTGLVVSEIKDCYPGIVADCNALIVGGTVIAVSNKELKSLVLHPRGEPFYTKLSGTVSATPGNQAITTSADLRREIRRGEAVKVGDSWYRVSSVIGSGAATAQSQRAVAPPSVTLDKDLSERNVYLHPFTDSALPLDGDYGGSADFSGTSLRHGCTTDIKDSWYRTAVEGLKRFAGDGAALRRELVVLNLVSDHAPSQTNTATAGYRKRTRGSSNGQRKRRKQRVVASNSLYGVNAHLKGTVLEAVLRETREKNLAADEGR